MKLLARGGGSISNGKFLRDDGKMVGWGNNRYGDLGVSTNVGKDTYVEACYTGAYSDYIIELFGGVYATSAISEKGYTYLCGNGRYSLTSNSYLSTETDGSKPLFNSAWSPSQVYMVKSNGLVYATVYNSNIYAPKNAADDTGRLNNVITVGAESYGNYNGFAVRSDGSVWGYGEKTNSQLGNGEIIINDEYSDYYFAVQVGEKPHLEISGAMLNGEAVEIHDGTLKKADGTLVSAVQVDDVIL